MLMLMAVAIRLRCLNKVRTTKDKRRSRYETSRTQRAAVHIQQKEERKKFAECGCTTYTDDLDYCRGLNVRRID
jgi:hypothetical protein